MGTELIVRRPVEVEVYEPGEGPDMMVRPDGYETPAQQLFAFGEMIAQRTAERIREELEPARLSDAELAFEWAKAFNEWLYTDPKHGERRPQSTINAYAAAWADLREFSQKEARFINGLDIRDWVEDLRRRPIDPTVHAGLVRNGRREAGQVGLSPATVGQYIAAVSSFFSYVERAEARTADGRPAALVPSVWVNPAKSHVVKRPKTRKFGQDVLWLDEEQLRALRSAIRSAHTLADLDRGVASDQRTIRELRDYALFTSYIFTGARNSEVRVWRWRDLRKLGGKMFYQWENKGKNGLDELPEPCWKAVQEYLRLSGRLDGAGVTPADDDYIFQPTSDAILRIKRPDGRPVIDPETWSRNRCISMQEVNRLLRKYCAKAGIEDARIHVHSLRHSSTMLYKAAGVSVEDRSRMLHHSSLDMTARYDHEMSGQENAAWQKAAQRLGL